MKRKYEKFITVLATGNHGLVALAKSILDDAKIKYYAKNEELEDLIGGGVHYINCCICNKMLKIIFSLEYK